MEQFTLSKPQRGRWYRRVPLRVTDSPLWRYNTRKTKTRKKGNRCLGMWDGAGRIRIEPKQRPASYLDSLVHELLHEFCPEFSENRVRLTAHRLSKVLWRKGYRRVAK